jgi:large subunit ribosomal protein L18e
MKKYKCALFNLYIKKISLFISFLFSGAEPIFALVGTVTDDVRQFEFPKVNVCALRFTEKARARITQNGGFCTTFDQLALNRPSGENVILLRGPRSREALLHFGPAPGVPGSTTK